MLNLIELDFRWKSVIFPKLIDSALFLPKWLARPPTELLVHDRTMSRELESLLPDPPEEMPQLPDYSVFVIDSALRTIDSAL